MASLLDVIPIVLVLDLPLRSDLDGAAADAGSRAAVGERASFTTLPKVVLSVMNSDSPAADEGTDAGVGDLGEMVSVPEESEVTESWD